MKITFKMSSIPVVIFSLLMTIGCKEDAPAYDGYTISGTVKGMETGWVKLVESSGLREKIVVLDSVQILNGSFEFKGKVESPDAVNLLIGNKQGRFFLENSSIDLKVDLNDPKASEWRFDLVVSGSKTNDTLKVIEEQIDAAFKKEKYAPLEQVRTAFTKAKKSKLDSDMQAALELQKELKPLMDERKNENRKIKFDFIKNNPSSPVAVYVMSFNYSESRMTRDELEEYYKLFKGQAKQTAFYQGYITKVYKDVFEKLGEGSLAPDFTLPTVEGGELTLSEVEGKYIYVDFWASWCVPCRASFPHIKELYGKYKKDGFNVVAVGTSDEEQKWKKAIIEDDTPWNHVFDGNPDREGRVSYGPVAKAYSVPFLPTTFLIDENMKIVDRNLKKEDLDAKLEELFGY